MQNSRGRGRSLTASVHMMELRDRRAGTEPSRILTRPLTDDEQEGHPERKRQTDHEQERAALIMQAVKQQPTTHGQVTRPPFGKKDKTSHQDEHKSERLVLYNRVLQWIALIAINAIMLNCLKCWISERCETSCIERWNNLHRRSPLDFKTWKKMLCPLLVDSNCTYPLRITLVDTSENFVPYDRNFMLFSNDVYGGYILYASYNEHRSEYKRYKHNNKKIEYIFHNLNLDQRKTSFTTINAVPFNHKKKSIVRSRWFRFKKNTKDSSVTVRKQSTIFSLHHFIEDPEILIRSLVFQLFGANNSDILSPMVCDELLTFVTAVDFKTGCYEFSHLSPMQENVSIEQEFGGKTYISEDDKMYLFDWILFRFTVYFVFLYIAIFIWGLAGRLLESRNKYLYIHKAGKNLNEYSTFLCCPSLISNNRALSDYLLKIACFRKFYPVGSSYVMTQAFFIIVRTILYYMDIDEYLMYIGQNKNDIIFFIYSYEGFLSILQFSFIFHYFIVEILVYRVTGKHVEFVPEPTEAVESIIPLFSFRWPLQSLQRHFTRLINFRFLKNIFNKILQLYSAYKKVHQLILLTVYCFILYFIYCNLHCKNNSVLITLGILISIYLLTLDNVMYTISNIFNLPFQFIVWYYFMIIIYPILLLNLEIIVYYLLTYVENIYSYRIWIPFMFLLMSYIKDVLIEYYYAYIDFFKSVLELIESNLIEDNDMKNRYVNGAASNEIQRKIAVLACDKVDENSLIDDKTFITQSGVMLFYNSYGIRSVTSIFFSKINKLSDCSLFKVARTCVFELSSLVIRMLPAILIFWLLRHIYKFPSQSIDEYPFLVGTILMQTYSKFCLQRGRFQNKITSTQFFKSSLFSCIRLHRDEYPISRSSVEKISVKSYKINYIYASFLFGSVIGLYLLNMSETFIIMKTWIMESFISEIMFQYPLIMYMQTALSFVSILTCVFYICLLL